MIANPDSSKTLVKALIAGVYQFELTVTDDKGATGKDTISVTLHLPTLFNKPPIANAGADQTITLPTDSVVLNGSLSNDPDGTIVSYQWNEIFGNPVAIISSQSVQTAVKNLAVGVYRFELVVTDNSANIARDTVLVMVNPTPACDNSNRPVIAAQLTPLGSLSKSREGIAVANAGNKIIFAGGYNECPLNCYGSSTVDIYDIVTHNWSTAQLSIGRYGISAIAAGNKVFFAGGQYDYVGSDWELYSRAVSTIDIYDASTNTWSALTLSSPRSFMTAAAVSNGLSNKVLFAGGVDNSTVLFSNKVDVLDLSTNSWSTAQISVPRIAIAAVTVDQKIYFGGGYNSSTPFNTIDIYNNNSNSWSTSALKMPMQMPAAIAVNENMYWSENCSVEIDNVNTGSSSMENLFAPSSQCVVLKDNKLVYFRSGSKKFDIYDIASKKWYIGVFPQNAIDPSSVISVNNVIYVFDRRNVYKLEF